ncbi:MAG: polysaccharide biosynthesis/export family protein [bacterium]
MRRNKIVTLLVFALMLNLSRVNSEEIPKNNANNTQNNAKSTKIINVEELKQELNALSSTPETNQLKARVKTLNTKYLISPGDTLIISVYGEPEFTQPEILVRPDGYTTIDPFGEVHVAGLSVDELTRVLKAQFKSYLIDPKVSVKLDNLHAAKIYVYGAVQKPGLYQQERIVNRKSTTGREILSTPELTVANVIASAGGVDYNADLRHVKVTNNETGKNQEVDLIKMLEKGDTSQDLYLRSGDSIYIPYIKTDAQISDNDFMLIASSSLAPNGFPVRVIGAVNKPGIYSLSSDSPRLNSAIAAAEGYQLYANKKAVSVQRLTPNGNVAKIYVEPGKNDIVLRPNDLVVVEDKSTALTSRGFNFMSSVVAPFALFSGAYNGWAEMFDPTRTNN